MLSPDDVIFHSFFLCRRNSSAFTQALCDVICSSTTSAQYVIIHIGGFHPNREGVCAQLTDFAPDKTASLHASTSSVTTLTGGTGIFCMSLIACMLGLCLLKNFEVSCHVAATEMIGMGNWRNAKTNSEASGKILLCTLAGISKRGCT